MKKVSRIVSVDAQRRYKVKATAAGMTAARNAVNNAVKKGELPRVSTLPCSKCGKPATGYHHHKGYAKEHRLSVIPTCNKCHAQFDYASFARGRRGSKVPEIEVSHEYRNVAHRGAYHDGYKTHASGGGKEACPYRVQTAAVVVNGRQMPDGHLSFANAWLAGWEDADKGVAPQCELPPQPVVIGQTFGRWTVVSESGRAKKSRRWLCRCQCGTERVLYQSNMKAISRFGYPGSCGCAEKKKPARRKPK